MDKQKRLKPHPVNLRFITLVLILSLFGGTGIFLSGMGENTKESAKGNTINKQAKKSGRLLAHIYNNLVNTPL